jgi:hypothetical protein
MSREMVFRGGVEEERYQNSGKCKKEKEAKEVKGEGGLFVQVQDQGSSLDGWRMSRGPRAKPRGGMENGIEKSTSGPIKGKLS